MEDQKSAQQQMYRPGQDTKPRQQFQERLRESAPDGIVCPKCGAVNEAGAIFCENCGTSLGSRKCPVCSAELVPGADVCESCGTYVSDDVCSFCGSQMMEGAQFCDSCGNPRYGIECPSCHNVSRFSFCTKCGMALTQVAKQQRLQYKKTSEYIEMSRLAEEYERLLLKIPVDGEAQQETIRKAEDIKRRFYALSSLPMPESKKNIIGQNMTADELQAAIDAKRQELQDILDVDAQPAQMTSAQVRLSANVHRPPLSKLGWKCNFRQEVHNCPQECACPQMGGKWLVK